MLTVSIVLYRTDRHQLDTLLNCVLSSLDKDGEALVDKIYLVDNSPDNSLSDYSNYCKQKNKIEYIFNNNNIGYGSAHNIALHKSIIECSDYHLILNPDIRFENDVLYKCVEYMNSHDNVGYLLPKVIYPDGTIQFLCKLLPTPTDLIFRRIIPSVWPLKKLKERLNDAYVLKYCGYNKIINPPCLSGCFMLLRSKTIQENNIFFDETFFMYLEDFDLMRRLHRVSCTIYYPEVTIIHDHAQESYKNKKMFKQHIKSAIQYFNKYGWIFDKERKEMNLKIEKEILELNNNGENN